MLPDWFEPTVVLFPAAAWLFLGVGLPWALVILPRAWWRESLIVLAVSMALGPLLHTAWMFVIGTLGALTLVNTLAGSAALAVIGAVLAIRRKNQPRPPAPSVKPERGRKPAAKSPLRQRGGDVGAGLIVAGIVLLIALNVVITAYWPFIAYDTQWVYGYNARLFVLHEEIPDDMGYYPQLIPLSYTFMQQSWDALGGDALNDHAARVVVPWFNTAAILMAYTLGLIAWRSRRAGLLTAAVWTFYPHVQAWAGAGDLEITLALYVTGAAAFFIAAWRSESARLALLSGLLLAGALWTKPTGGALALGVMLAVGVALIRTRFDLAAWMPKFRIAAIAGLASAPLGGMWYMRNLLLGHEPVTFPASYWHDFAQRSGQEFGWPLVIAGLVAGGLMFTSPLNPLSMQRRGDFPTRLSPPLRAWRGGRGVRLVLPFIALALLLLGALPTALDRIDSTFDVWQWARGDITAGGRMSALEWLPVIAGTLLLVWSASGAWQRLDSTTRETVVLIVALMLPYAFVWFRDFSYHYRLSFAIVPLAATLVAALIDGWLWDWLATRRVGQIAGLAALAAIIGLATAAGAEHTVDAWRDGDLPDDTAKYDRGNPALMVVVHMLEDVAAEHGGPLVVSIPGEDRLPFFFPTWDIRYSREVDDLPLTVEDLAGVDVFVNSSPGRFLMQIAGLWPNSLQAEAEVGAAYHRVKARGWDGDLWPTVLEPIPLAPDGSLPIDDGNFRYEAFTIHPEARDTPMNPGAQPQGEVLFGDFAQFIGYDVVTLDWVRGERVILSLYWRPTESAPPPQDYSIYVHLLDAEGTYLYGWDGVPLQGAYPTRFWRPGESLLDYWTLRIPDDVPRGPAQLRIGIYDPISGERLPVTVDGEMVGDGLTINQRITVR